MRSEAPPADSDGLAVDAVTVAPGADDVLVDASLEVARGEVVAVLGGSGTGKTTLLRAVAGLERVTSGRIRWAGDDITDVAPHRRGFGLMFQDHALFPHRDVTANVAFGLRMQRRPRSARRSRVAEVLELLDIGHLAERAVADLSGGEAQRVALGRALAPEPGLVLFDEPLSSLDRPLRDRLVVDLRALLADLGQTALYVTHDFDEAAAVADRIAVLRKGRVARLATPAELRDDPGDAATAAMVGHPNVVTAVGEGSSLVTDWGEIAGWPGPQGAMAVVIAPTAVLLTPTPTGSAVVITTRVYGDAYRVIVADDAGRQIAASATQPPPAGARVNVRIEMEGIRALAP
ncbi:MAG: ABC transporter ATP-binding protein [Acidimicrobiales bacterium]